jgi:hypothetical protein
MGRHCPKCKCGVIYTGERDVTITIIYDHQQQIIDVGRIVTPYCGSCFRVLPQLDPDAQIAVENATREQLGLLLPGEIMDAWAKDPFIGEGLQQLADRAGMNLQMLELIMTYETLQSRSMDVTCAIWAVDRRRRWRRIISSRIVPSSLPPRRLDANAEYMNLSSIDGDAQAAAE